MVGVRSAQLSILIVTSFAAACARHASSTPKTALAAKPPVVAQPVYRFVSLGPPNEFGQQVALDAGRIGIITDGAPGREIINPDGSVELSAPEGGGLLGVVPVPARLGGGFLFWSDVLYLARSFTGPLQPVATLPTNAIGLEFGPDYVLLLVSNSPPRAFALNPARSVSLSPKGVIDVVATDDGRALALDSAGRALASTDAGKSWKDVTSALGARVSGVDEGEHGVAFVLRKADAWLQLDGQFVQRAPAKNAAEARTTPAVLLRQAISAGLPLPGMRALLGDGNGTRVVDLRTGSVSPVKPAGPEGSSCVPVSVEEQGVLVCTNYSSRPTTTVISHALAETPVIEKKFSGSPHFMAARELSMLASCAGGRAEDSVCLRRNGGVWTELTVAPEVLKAWQPAFWVPRENGGVSLIISQAGVSQGSPKAALLDPETNRITVWDSTIEQVIPNNEAWRSGESFTVLADGSLRGYTAKGSIAVDPKGHVTVGTQTFASLSCAGVQALARSDDEHLWQSNDWGAHWLSIARPPFDDTPEGTGAKLNPRPSGRASRIDCTRSGCVLDHSSGTGFWLRLGWPQDPPTPANPSQPPLIVASAPAPTAPVLEPADLALPQFRCSSRHPGPLQLKTLANPPEPQRGEEWQNVLGGNRALVQRGTVSFANIAYRDAFSTELARDNGLRAALHVPDGDPPLTELVGKKTPFDVLFVEPFDAQGRVRKVTTSIKDWSAFDAAAPGRDPLHPRGWRQVMVRDVNGGDPDRGLARPLLSSEPGRAGGVLLIGALSLWAQNAGQVRPIRPGCSPVSGYLDAHGKGFVACADEDASTSIEALDTPKRALVSAPPAFHFRARERRGLKFFAPGESPFVNPDAIAVAQSGKFGILRLPPGDEPPTADNPAWLLGADASPIELAPWSTLELATSPACADGDGYRAIIQTGKSWLGGGTLPFWEVTMTALVRWGTKRVCLEAVEAGDSALGSQKLSAAVQVSAVARFAGAQPGAAFIGTESNAAVREPATCDFRTWAQLSAPQAADRLRNIRSPIR